MEVPWIIRWVSAILWTLPAPTDSWVELVAALAWPAVAIFTMLRFRLFIRQFLYTLLNRFKTDHVKTPLFELTPNAPVYVLDPDEVDESTEHFSSDDIQRVEAIFEFIAKPAGYFALEKWLNEKFSGALDIEDFVTDPTYANERALAFNEIEGLKI